MCGVGLLDSFGYLRCRRRPARSKQSVGDSSRQDDQDDRCNLFRRLHSPMFSRPLSHGKRSSSKVFSETRNGHGHLGLTPPPLSLIPTFLVPRFAILYVICIVPGKILT